MADTVTITQAELDHILAQLREILAEVKALRQDIARRDEREDAR